MYLEDITAQPRPMNADKFDILFAIPFPKSVLSYANPNSKESVILWPFHCICQAIREYSKESATIMIKCTSNAQSYSQRWCIVQTTIKRQNCADYNPNLVRLSSFQWMLDVWDTIEQIGQLNHVFRGYYCPTIKRLNGDLGYEGCLILTISWRWTCLCRYAHHFSIFYSFSFLISSYLRLFFSFLLILIHFSDSFFLGLLFKLVHIYCARAGKVQHTGFDTLWPGETPQHVGGETPSVGIPDVCACLTNNSQNYQPLQYPLYHIAT